MWPIFSSDSLRIACHRFPAVSNISHSIGLSGHYNTLRGFKKEVIQMFHGATTCCEADGGMRPLLIFNFNLLGHLNAKFKLLCMLLFFIISMNS